MAGRGNLRVRLGQDGALVSRQSRLVAAVAQWRLCRGTFRIAFPIRALDARCEHRICRLIEKVASARASAHRVRLTLALRVTTAATLSLASVDQHHGGKVAAARLSWESPALEGTNCSQRQRAFRESRPKLRCVGHTLTGITCFCSRECPAGY